MKRAIAFVSIAVLFMACSQTGENAAESSQSAAGGNYRTVTIDGYVPDTGVLVNPTNVWQEPGNPGAGWVGRVDHGTQVKMIRQEEDYVLIQLPDGKEGWVQTWNIKELK